MNSMTEIVRETANNMQALLMQLASHIEKLEAENKELRTKLEAYSDDFK